MVLALAPRFGVAASVEEQFNGNTTPWSERIGSHSTKSGATNSSITPTPLAAPRRPKALSSIQWNQVQLLWGEWPATRRRCVGMARLHWWQGPHTSMSRWKARTRRCTRAICTSGGWSGLETGCAPSYLFAREEI